jgi:4,5-dihydroxyphthalate decarboxylase
MAKPVLSFAYGRTLRSAALLDGEVEVEGVELVPSQVHMSELAWRQLRPMMERGGEFDVSELSISSLLISVDHGNPEYVAIPCFPYRSFFHTAILVRTDAGIDEPKDLIGKRVGIPEYQQTGALWVRHPLLHEFGVKPSDMEWWMGRSPNLSHGGATGFKVPEGVTMHYAPESTNLGEMILNNELDALLMYVRNTLVDRSTVDLDSDNRVRHLFADPVAEGVRYYKKTGIYPINHTLTIRRSLVEKYPWLPQNLYNAFLESKRLGEKRLREAAEPYVTTGAMTKLTGDPFPYGFRANQVVLEALREGSHEQGLTTRLIGFEEAFVPDLLGL